MYIQCLDNVDETLLCRKGVINTCTCIIACINQGDDNVYTRFIQSLYNV